MSTNVLKAMINIKNFNNYIINDDTDTVNNRINQEGVALETFVKDAFSNSFNETDKELKKKKHCDYFSYLGTKNNPPDAMIKNGDAIEVKKSQTLGDIQLNSSYPKNKLFVDDSRINEECKKCEEWEEKDLLYVFGYMPKNKNNKKSLKLISFIYGDCFAADKEVYTNLKNQTSNKLNELSGASIETNEIARFNELDSLGVTSLRVRPMWILDNPIKKIFKDIFQYEAKKTQFSMICLMKKEKFESFPNEDKQAIKNDNEFTFDDDVQISDPNNSSNLIDCVYIRFDVNE